VIVCPKKRLLKTLVQLIHLCKKHCATDTAEAHPVPDKTSTQKRCLVEFRDDGAGATFLTRARGFGLDRDAGRPPLKEGHLSNDFPSP
jgi:hypothetical protein